MDNATGDDGGDGGAFEGAGVEGGVAGFAGGLLYVVSPFMSCRENCEVGGLVGSNFAFDAEDAGRTRRVEFDHAHEREAVGVD